MYSSGGRDNSPHEPVRILMILSIHSPSQEIKVMPVKMSSFFQNSNVHLLNRLLPLFCTTPLLVLHIPLFQQPGNGIDSKKTKLPLLPISDPIQHRLV